MRIYVAHSRAFNFRKELYNPLKAIDLVNEYSFVFPHDNSDESFSSKDLFQKGFDLILAEVSYPSTGLGIELGWADFLKIPIVSIYKADTKISRSLNIVSSKLFEYSDSEDMIAKVIKVLSTINPDQKFQS